MLRLELLCLALEPICPALEHSDPLPETLHGRSRGARALVFGNRCTNMAVFVDGRPAVVVAGENRIVAAGTGVAEFEVAGTVVVETGAAMIVAAGVVVEELGPRKKGGPGRRKRALGREEGGSHSR